MTLAVAPLAIVADVLVCDGRFPHELDVVTDGHHAYAWGAQVEASAGHRVGTAITFTCNQLLPYVDANYNDEHCDGTVTIDLATQSVWTSDLARIELLVEYGQPVERPAVHDHEPMPTARPADPKVCTCGKRRDPVTTGWYAADEFEQLLAARRERRAMFGATASEGEANARAMNALGL